MIGRTTLRWPDRVMSMMALRLVLWVTVAAFTHEGILSDPFKVADWMDDHQFYSWEESDRTTLLRYHQLPAWNPFWCGGTVGLAGPEDPFLGPDFLLRLVFGVGHGRRLAIVLLVVLGFEGMYRLCRRLDSSAVGAAFAALVYGTCDRFVSFIHDGWVNFMGFELIPFILYFLVEGTLGPADPTVSDVERSERIRRARLLGGFFVAWIILSAGTYPTPYAMISVGYVTLVLSVHGFFRGLRAEPDVAGDGSRGGQWLRVLRAPWLVPWLAAATIGLVALGLSAGKMLPTLSFLRQFPRVFTPVEMHSAAEMFTGFWSRYSVVLVLALIGVVTADLAAGVFFGGALLFFALAMGDFGESSPFHLLKSLPIFGQLRFPDRFMVGVLLFTAVAASRGITRVEDALPAAVKRAWERFFGWRQRAFGAKDAAYPPEVGWVIVGVAAFVACSRVALPFAEEILTGVRIRPGTMYVQEGPRNHDAPFKQSRGNRRDVHLFTPSNMGSIYCVAGNPLPESALLRGDLAQEEYPQDPTKATVKRLVWTPNEITLEVDAKEPTTVLVNQNWAAEWRSNVGVVKSVEKLLAVDVPAGKHVVVLSYKDRFLGACLLVSLASLLGVAFVLGRDGVRWAKRERARWATLPLWPHEIAEPAATAETDGTAAPPEPSASASDEGDATAERADADPDADERADDDASAAGASDDAAERDEAERDDAERDA
ncbi:MAG: hypothetical protein KF795_17085 [Labilithrix sp.]|nr:hypothetical protein [Labilithrix sp.]